MAAKHKVTVSMQPTNHQLSTTERRAAQVASLSTQQAVLKQEAADRRDERATKSAADALTPRDA
jgi:phosphoenolpyruvate-protein kinase (PTS system EI component)